MCPIAARRRKIGFDNGLIFFLKRQNINRIARGNELGLLSKKLSAIGLSLSNFQHMAGHFSCQKSLCLLHRVWLGSCSELISTCAPLHIVPFVTAFYMRFVSWSWIIPWPLLSKGGRMQSITGPSLWFQCQFKHIYSPCSTGAPFKGS